MKSLLDLLGGPQQARRAPRTHDVASVPAGPVYGPYEAREWRGMVIHPCPACDYAGTSAGALARHIASVHPIPIPPEPESVAERAERSGIILASR